MSDVDQQQGKLLVVLHDGIAYVHVVGRGCCKNSIALKQFGIASMEQDCQTIVLNMVELYGDG